MDPIPNDARLIEASLLDPSAFAHVYERHAPVLLGYLVRRVGHTEAESLLGEMFRIAFESRRRYDLDRASAAPWLYGIAANLVMKHFRSQGRQRVALERLSAQRQIVLSADESVVNNAVNEQLLSQVIELIGDLLEGDREVVFLFAWQELSYSEIAEALDIPVGTVRSRLNRVRTLLRELQPVDGKEPDIATMRTKGVI